jgi:hypothetical protein
MSERNELESVTFRDSLKCPIFMVVLVTVVWNYLCVSSHFHKCVVFVDNCIEIFYT